MLRPFSRFCVSIGAIPPSIIQSISYQEQLNRLIKFLRDTVIPAIEGNKEAIEAIEDWIENVDLQEYIDNRLDEMAEEGTLQEIIAAYLNTNALIGFSVKNDMLNAENLINGCYARTCGLSTVNDGGAHLYKIRTRTYEDVIDNDNITVMLTDENLVAVKIIDEIVPNKIIMIGDSYGNDSGEWTEIFRDSMKKYDPTYTNSDFYNWCVSGSSAIERTGTSFPTYLEIMQSNNNVITNKEYVKSIILCGGYNDNTFSHNDLVAALQTFFNYCKTNYPNAKIYFGCIGWDTNTTSGAETIRTNIIKNVVTAYKDTTIFGGVYLNGVENVPHVYGSDYWKQDGYHPNTEMSKLLGKNIFQAYISGSTEFSIEVTEQIGAKNLLKKIHGNNTLIHIKELYYNYSDSPISKGPGAQVIELDTLTSNILRNELDWSWLPCNCIINTAASGRLCIPGLFYYKEGKFYLRIYSPDTISITSLQIDINSMIDTQLV